MTTSKVTALEEEMFEKGYVSSRMAAFKLKKDFKTVLRQVSRGQFKAVRRGTQQFICMESITAWYATPLVVNQHTTNVREATVESLNLHDWSDVFTVDEEENLHVRRED